MTPKIPDQIPMLVMVKVVLWCDQMALWCDLYRLVTKKAPERRQPKTRKMPNSTCLAWRIRKKAARSQ